MSDAREGQMKARIVHLPCTINPHLGTYAAVEFVPDDKTAYPRIWRLSYAAYESDPARSMLELQAIVDGVNNRARLIDLTLDSPTLWLTKLGILKTRG